MTLVAKIILYLILIFIGWVLVVGIASFFIYFRPPKFPVTKTPSYFGMEFERVSFETEDKKILSGWFIPSSKETKTTILLLHGYLANKGYMLNTAKLLQPEYNLFLFDFRAHGESQGTFSSIGFYEIRDVLGAIDYLKREKKEKAEKLGALGFSLGGAVAIMATEKSPEISAIVADSSYATFERMIFSTFRLTSFMKKPMTTLARYFGKIFFKIDAREISPQKVAEKIKIPIFLIHGREDSEISIEDSRMIFEAASGPKEFWQVEGAEHGEALYLYSKEYQEKVLNFFNKYLGNIPQL